MIPGMVVKLLQDPTKKGILMEADQTMGMVLWYDTGWTRTDPISLDQLGRAKAPENDPWVQFLHRQLSSMLLARFQ